MQAFSLASSAEISKIKTKTLSEAIKIKEECRENGIDIITYKDKKYPFCLSVLPDFPLVLYVKGNMPDFESIPTICIVGPRKVSEYGKRAAYSLSFRLALSGFIIVSGGALGIQLLLTPENFLLAANALAEDIIFD